MIAPVNSRDEEFPSGRQALAIVLALFLAEYVVGAGLFDARRVLGLDEDAISALTVLLGNGLVFSALMHLKGLGFRQLLHPSTASPAAVATLLLPPVLMLVPAMVLGVGEAMKLLVALVPLSAWEEATFVRFGSGSVAMVVAICVLAPILEEMLFRGVFLRSFLTQYPRWQAILGSAILFGVAHLNLYQFFAALMLGTIAGWLYERTRSLYPCIALHGGYNTLLTVLSSAEPESSAASAEWMSSAAGWTTALTLATVGALWLRRLLVPARHRAGAGEPAPDFLESR